MYAQLTSQLDRHDRSERRCVQLLRVVSYILWRCGWCIRPTCRCAAISDCRTRQMVRLQPLGVFLFDVMWCDWGRPTYREAVYTTTHRVLDYAGL